MEDFTSDILKVLNKPSTSLSEMNSNMELLNNFSESNHLVCSQGYGFLDYFSNNNFSSNDPNTAYPSYLNDIEFTIDQTNGHVPQSLLSVEGNLSIEKDEKSSMPMSEFMEMGSSSGFRIDNSTTTNGRKRKRKYEERLEKPREVIHVRAKRGQATDSHSLAERVRREKINEKLKVLQDLVPGCYKTMGMAVLLDVIINYVRSLQNQIEFLSMKLSAASLYYDFNSPEAEALESLHRMTNPPCDNYHETNKAVRSEEYQVHSPAWPF